MHWQRHKSGAEHMRQMVERGEKMPVCIVIGSDPASMYSASAPLPPNIDEFLFAGFLRRDPVKLAKAVTCDLEVPADAEIVIEGYIDPAEALVVEGPVWRSHRILFRSRFVSAGARDGRDDAQESRCTSRPLSVDRQWKISISGTPPSASFCRCSS